MPESRTGAKVAPLHLRAILFANGVLSDCDSARAAIHPDDWLICADGGLRHCRALGLTPHVVIGDFDSLAPGDFAALQAENVRLILHPRNKDQTDLELAIRHAVEGGAQDIVILGALGARWDQTLANLLLPALPAFAGARIRLLDGNQQIHLFGARTIPPPHHPTTFIIEGRPGSTVSLIPLRGDAHGVTTSGLEYPLNNGALPFGSTLGISNTLVGERATVEVKEGLVMCVVINVER